LKKFNSLSLYFVISAHVMVFPQTPRSNSTLTANPVFEKNCAKCHGKNSTGRHFGGPSLLSEKVKAASPEDLREVITNGKGRMPKFAGKLPPEEIEALVQQIKAQQVNSSK
jgi:mono/diheme cytochrome c family protein